MKISFLAIHFIFASILSAAPVGLHGKDGNPAQLEKGTPSIRSFPAWETLQPTPEKWNHDPADEFVKTAREKSIEIIGIFHQPAPWASSGNTQNGFPLANRKAWGDYVFTIADRHKNITHWDVLDSYNRGARQTNTPFHYVELLTTAYDSAKKANPNAKVGFSLADYDLEFLDEALRSGAGKKLDYLSLSPFQFTTGTDRQFATVLPTVRALLASHELPADIPVHITLTGTEKNLPHAAALARSLGFDRVFIKSTAALLQSIPDETPTIPAPESYKDKGSLKITLGETNKSEGIFQPVPSTTPWDKENKAARLSVTGSPAVYQTSFLVDPAFISPDQNEIEITFHISRIPSEEGLTNPTGFVLTYESVHGIITTSDWYLVPGDNEWQTKTYKLTDAAFKGKLGWNFRINAAGAGSDLLIRKVVLKK